MFMEKSREQGNSLPVTWPTGDINLPFGRKRKCFHMSASSHQRDQHSKGRVYTQGKRTQPRSFSIVRGGLFPTKRQHVLGWTFLSIYGLSWRDPGALSERTGPQDRSWERPGKGLEAEGDAQNATPAPEVQAGDQQGTAPPGRGMSEACLLPGPRSALPLTNSHLISVSTDPQRGSPEGSFLLPRTHSSRPAPGSQA